MYECKFQYILNPFRKTKWRKYIYIFIDFFTKDDYNILNTVSLGKKDLFSKNGHLTHFSCHKKILWFLEEQLENVENLKKKTVPTLPIKDTHRQQQFVLCKILLLSMCLITKT